MQDFQRLYYCSPPGTPAVACPRARVAAIHLAATASPATSSMPAIVLVAMGMTRVLDAFPRRAPWATRASTGPRRLSMALKRCTSLPSVTGEVWTIGFTRQRGGVEGGGGSKEAGKGVNPARQRLHGKGPPPRVRLKPGLFGSWMCVCWQDSTRQLPNRPHMVFQCVWTPGIK